MRLGFVVNPVAGMGGRVGLKGTDGKVSEARERGAERRSPDRAREALAALRDRRQGPLTLLVAGGPMGADAARAAGVEAEVVTDPPADPFETSAEDTRAAVRGFLERDVDLVAFVGGDGTAVDVAETIRAADAAVPMLGVPAGVKVYSGVFGATPAAAGRLLADFEPGGPTAEREVNDIDEDAFRGGEVETELRAVVRVPVGEDVQTSKQVGGGTVESLAAGVASEVGPGETYVLGPGSTLAAVKRELGFEGTPLGVDVYRDGEVLRDVSETGILDALREDPADNVVVVSPIGGQGFFLGRGNQQISPAVVRRATVEVVASDAKLDDTGVLRVDTGDPDLDEELRGWRKVRVGRFERRMMQVV